MKKKLFIRADGNSRIGLGHIMRSMTIALEFKKRGHDCIYLSSKPVPFDIFERYKFDVIEVDYNYDRKTIEEANAISEIVKDNYLLIDSYWINNEYLKVLKAICTTICINSTKEKLITDWLINENIACNQDYIFRLYSGCDTHLLLGERYIPIRKEFQAINYQLNDSVRNVLITTGGGDQYNFMTEFVKLIKNKVNYKNYKFVFISGACNAHVDELENEAKECKNIVVVKNTFNISDFMKNSDIAISTGGTTILELSVVGVPTIGIAVAQDQIKGLMKMHNLGMIQYAGKASEACLIEKVDMILNDLLDDRDLRIHLSKESSKYIDGNGAERIFRQITGK